MANTYYRRKAETAELEEEAATLKRHLKQLELENAVLSKRAEFLQVLSDMTALVDSVRSGHVLQGASAIDHLELYRVDVAAVKAMDVHAYAQRFLDFAGTAALLLPHCRPGGDPQLACELEWRLRHHDRVTLALMLHNAHTMFAARCVPLRAGYSAVPPPHHVASVIRSLNWSGFEAVRGLVCAAASWFLLHMERLSLQRAQLSLQLEAATEAKETVRVAWLVDAIAASMEQQLRVNAVAVALTAVFMPVPLSVSVFVGCYPYYPVLPSLARALLDQRVLELSAQSVTIDPISESDPLSWLD